MTLVLVSDGPKIEEALLIVHAHYPFNLFPKLLDRSLEAETEMHKPVASLSFCV